MGPYVIGRFITRMQLFLLKYFDYNSGAWVATIDFGDRTCDEWATKTTHDDNGEAFVFSLDDWKK